MCFSDLYDNFFMKLHASKCTKTGHFSDPVYIKIPQITAAGTYLECKW